MARLNITVSVEGIQIPLTVETTEEEKVYRDAAVRIQDCLRNLRQTFPSLGNEKYYYAMAMLVTAVEAVKQSNEVDNTPMLEMMSDLTDEIKKALK